MPSILLPLLAASTLSAAPDTTTYLVLNHGRRAGEMVVVREGESVAVRYAHIDRNRGRWLRSRYRITADGRILSGESQALSIDGDPNGPATRFEVVGDSVRWSGREDGAAPLPRGGFYRLGNGTAYDAALLAAYLLKQPRGSAPLVPDGTARVEIVADTMLTLRGGPRRVRLAMVHGPGNTPDGVWIDERGELVASDVAWFITVRPDAVDALPVMRAIEVAYRDAHGEAIAARVKPARQGTFLIRNGDLFDAERGIVRPRTSVLVRDGRIAAIGPVDSVRAPAGAATIDATGKTIVPGLWDMHGHFQLTSQSSGSVSQLARGITTVRDLAADLDVAVSHRDRADRGTILAPRAVLAGFIEGPGAWAGPSEALARTEAEARAWVARYDSLGYRQIKLYNLLHPDLVPVIAEETEQRGMRLSGHVPRGMSVAAAVTLGFDEINHAAFLFSTHYPDSLYVPRMRPYSGVAAAVAPNIDVDSPEMTAMIDVLREQATVVDGTFNLWLRDTTGSNASTARRANAAYLRLIKRLYDAGVTLVPGTDNSSGSTYHEELEIYERAGIPTPHVLQMATIIPARVMGDEAEYGSIAPGKVADIVIVDGRPTERISDLRRVDWVIRAGRAYEPTALFEAVGMRQARRRADSGGAR